MCPINRVLPQSVGFFREYRRPAAESIVSKVPARILSLP
jgi:hypothetical protein